MSRLTFPEDMFKLRPGETPMYGHLPELKQAVEFFKSLMKQNEWETRRHAIGMRFYQSLIGELNDPTGKGHFFNDDDLFGWYLFLGEAFNDHPQNYDVVFGCRVVPVLATIGRNLNLLQSIDGFMDKAERLINSDKRQPNSILFEILVAGAYAQEGGVVVFRPELPGKAKTHDIDVEIKGTVWAVECKRMESGEYHEGERQRMRDLWRDCASLLVEENRNTILDVQFKIELTEVPDSYLFNKIKRYARTQRSSVIWDDSVSNCTIGNLDIGPAQNALKSSYWLHPGPQFYKLLMGSYRRNDSHLVVMRAKFAENPHFIDELDLAIVARWSSLSDQAVEKKARDILKRLAEANQQLPLDAPGVIHIGFEALGANAIERRRYEKIMDTARKFDRGGTQLQYIYCHYFAPEASPEESWAIDETVQWLGIHPDRRPLKTGRLLPSDGPGRSGVHWDGNY